MKQSNKKEEAKSTKQCACEKVANWLLSIYGLFRECSGIKKYTDKKMSEIRQNEEDIVVVKRELPKVKKGISSLEATIELKNRQLKVVTSDVLAISELYKRENFVGIEKILNKYESLLNKSKQVR